MFGRGGAPESERTGGQPGSPPKLSKFALSLAAILFLISVLLTTVPYFEILELKTEDVFLRLRGPKPIHEDIVVIEIDEKTLESYDNQWPFGRDQHALLIAALNAWGAQAIGMDLWFSGADADTVANDQMLAAVTSNTPQLIHAVYFPLQEPGTESLPAGSISTGSDSLMHATFPRVPEGWELMTSFKGYIDLPKELLEVEPTLAHIALASDVDGVIRRTPLLIDHEGSLIPSLPLVMSGTYLGFDWKTAVIEQNPFSEWGYLRISGEGLERRIPIDKYGRAIINFPGDETKFPNRYLYINVINSASSWLNGEEIPADFPQPEEFEGKVVLICNTAFSAGIADFGPTPYAAVFPLPYAHASTVNSILRDQFVQDAPRWTEVLVLGVIAIAGAIAFPLLAPAMLAIVAVSGIVLVVLLAWLVLFFGGVQIPVIQPQFLILGLSVGILLHSYLMREKERLQLEQELSIAHKIQQDLLPKDPLDLGVARVTGTNLPCYEIGGDYFDYFPLDNGLILVAIGDVAGKGVPASLLMSNIQAILRTECARFTSVPETLANANRLLMDSIQGSSKFITFFLATVDPKSGEVVYSNAGHNPPILCRKDGSYELLEEGGLILGIFPMATYESGTRTLGKDDVLVMFTDGVTEAEDRQKNQYGDDKLEKLVVDIRGQTAKQIADRICDEVQEFSKGIHATDDTTVVVVKADDPETEKTEETAES